MTGVRNPLYPHAVDSIVGISKWTQQIREQILEVSQHASNVLITGPSGTGKELIARAIHFHSSRADKPFIPADCAATTGTLFASHMFGHIKGAFTGARNSSLGCFRAADGGSIFLDEIGELELELQPKLLRVLQQRTVVPVGSHEETPVDVRIVAATNRNLRDEITSGGFREDLFYRLNVVSLRTVPLCERLEDIPIMSHHILAKLAIRRGTPMKQLSEEAIRRLCSYHWPGNVRELENVLERAVLFSKGEVIGPDAALIPDEMDPHPPAPQNRLSDAWSKTAPQTEPERKDSPPKYQQHWRSMEEVEREHIRQTLEFTFYNQSAAARLLKMHRNILHRKIKKYSLDNFPPRRGRPPKSPISDPQQP